MCHEVAGRAGEVSRPHEEGETGKPAGTKGTPGVSVSVCVSPSPLGQLLLSGSTQLPPNGCSRSRVYRVILEFLIPCNRQLLPTEIRRYTKNKSRGSWLSENVFHCFSLFPSLDPRDQRDRDGETDVISPLAVGRACLDEGRSPPG